ncbi:MAG: RNA polymerase sigma-70 factor [Tannerellaceae bacterium]|jgi:RNA polymerase sigma-70 factor (ECF subfamily)|nr:RNA polymerase sigma-70 factor [Tannerellaceae bacterium]
MEIKKLLTLVSEDKQGSFDLFFNLYYDQVFRFAFYYLKNREICREVVTDVFFSVWQSRKRLSAIANIETYLYVVVRNEATRYLSNKQKHSFVSIEDIPVQIGQEEESPEQELLTKEMEAFLSKVISELPEKCRVIFLMAREEGLKTKEIAEILSIQESTVRVQMKIAIDKIVASVKPHFPDLTLSVLLINLFIR